MKRIITATVFTALLGSLALAQENPFPKFKLFRDVAPGIDFYANERSQVDPFVKTLTEVREKIGEFLGDIDARGAIFICSTLDQKDSVYDLRVFKSGYKWYLPSLTSEAQREERNARMAQAAAAAGEDTQAVAAAGGRQGRGGQQRGGGRSAQGGQGRGDTGRGGRQGGQAGAEARAATALATQMGYAILMSSLDNPKQYRVSRLDDMSRSPLNDWLDIALVAYATGTITNSYRTLMERTDDTFPLDDVLSMSRPFVATQDPMLGGGGGFPGGMGGGRGGGGTRVLPKDVLDRMVFDAQASAFFNYVREKAGIDKLKDLVKQNLQGTESVDVVQMLFGKNFDQTQRDFMAWVKAQVPSNPAATGMGSVVPMIGFSR